MRNKILMTLALLLTAVTGAWAADTYTITFSANGKNKTYTDVALPAEYKCEYGSPGEFDNIIQELYGLNGGHPIENETPTVTGTNAITPALYYGYAIITITAPFTGKATVSGKYYGNSDFNYSIEVYFDTPIDVKWDAATKTGTFKMPAFDVEIAPIYAPVAQWAKVDNVDQLPTAVEGIYAESTDAIVKAGTVAKIGETENPQGTVMYAVTGANQATAPELTAFSADVPTAKDITTAGDVYVWYYIKGADTPQGETATAENTFNDSEICAEPIKVTVLNNKFDIQFNAANANTIEATQASKGTVSVKEGTDAAVDKTSYITDEGKLEGVKMGSEVKITAKEGYKFRKVEAKKKSASKLASEVTTEDIFKVIASDGMIYDNIAAAESAGTVAQGLVVYVGSNTGHNTYTHGMALALKDESDNTWSGAKDACNAKNTSTPIVGALWIQASKDQWNTMFNAVGNDSKLRDCFSSAGGTNLVKFGNYWSGSSHEDYGEQGDFYIFSEDDGPGGWGSTSVYYNDNYHVRACIVF